MIANFSVAAGAALLTWFFCWLHCRRKAAWRARAHQQRTAELEDKAWRAQMNPHFLNNCLNSVSAIIHQHDISLAAHYLASLSKLTRTVLMHSQERMIPLAEELDLVNQYLTLERLRFGDQLIVDVSVADGLEPTNILVPPLALQPFVENAVIHGLLPRGTGGTISLSVFVRDGTLHCHLSDDGVGRTARNNARHATGIPKRSLGIGITRKRIAHFNAHHGCTLPFVIRDRMDAEGGVSGTVVEVQLALVNDT